MMLALFSSLEQKRPLKVALFAWGITFLTILTLALAGCATSDVSSQEVKNNQTSAEEEEPLVDNPINFAELKAQSPDIYAWLYVPEMDINRPIFQSSTNKDIDYYLSHDVNGIANGIGEAYTQPFNSKDFTDPVTLVYGHSIQGTTEAFTNLHRLEDPATFAANEYFYIITPNKILTYRIITVQEVSDAHILKNDFTTDEGQQEYFDSLLNPTAPGSLVREDVELIGGESKLVHLVTCPVPSKYGARVIIGGLLVSEQKTIES